MQTTLKYLLLSFIILLTSFSNAQEAKKNFVVVLDAGHGGKDPGRPTKFDLEKNVALKIALNIGKALEQHKDIKVIYTRKTDVFLELHERARIANKADADIFVSIHCNAHNSQAYGTETFVLSVGNTERNMSVAKAENEVIFLEDNHEVHYEGFDPSAPESLIGLALLQEDYVEQSIWLANRVEHNFSKNLKRKSRGVKQQSLWVMHNTYMPSVLIEAGFLTNNVEGKYLSSKKGQQQISNEITKALLEYKENWVPTTLPDFSDSPKTIDTIEDETQVIKEDTQIIDGVTFKVQISAGSKRLSTKPYNFKGLKEISRDKHGKIFKYYYGETSDYKEIKALQKHAKSKGYKTSFIVAYKNGERISVKDALKSTSN